MPHNPPYDQDVARAYDLLVHASRDAEADETEIGFLRWAFEEVAERGVRDVLDIGCGSGYWMLPLARLDYALTGIDHSAPMLDLCYQRLRAAGLSAELHRMGMLSLDYEESFDVALCTTSILCYLPDAEAIVEMLRKLWRALRPGGLLVIENANLCAQWYCQDEPYHGKRSGGGMEIDYTERHTYEDFTSIYHIFLDAVVREGGRSYEVHSEEVLRAMTVGEVTAHLEAVDFDRIAAYPAFDLSLAGETSSDRMILLALRPDARG